MKNSISTSPTAAATLTNRLTDWRVYAAAGVATLAATSAADASIIYSGTLDQQFHTFSGGAAGGSIAIGGERMAAFINYGAVSAEFIAPGGHTNTAPKFFATNGYLPINFIAGSVIGGSHAHPEGDLRRQFRSSNGSVQSTVGKFAAGKSGFLGFRFPGSEHGGGEGWIRVEVEANGAGAPVGVEIIDWAYNDAGGGIFAGEGVSVPEPSALGLLALGSAGVLAWRRRRTAPAR